MDEKRSGDDRRKDFRAVDKAVYYCKGLESVFDEYMSDHEYGFPMPLITDGTRIIKAPYKIMKDWLGHDFKNTDLRDIYIDPGVREKVLSSVKENEFIRFFPHVYKANGSSIVLDVLITMKTFENSDKRYYCFVDIED